MMTMKLYSGPLSMFGAKAEIAVLEKGVACAREFVPFSLQTFYEPRHPEVRRVNPKLQVPVLVDDDLDLFDSTQIFEYLEDLRPEPALWPRDVRARARARLLELESDEVFFPNVVAIMPHNRMQTGEGGVAAATTAIRAYYDGMERLLDGREFLAGPYGYADIAFFMAQFFARFLGMPWSADHPRLEAWRARVGARPAVRQVAGAMADYLRAQGLSTAVG